MKRQNKKQRYFDFVDLPIMAFIGVAAGFFLVGFIQTTVGTLFEATDGDIFSVRAIVAGVLCVTISVAVLALASLYWKMIPKRNGIVYPEFTGFGTIIALMTMFSGAMLASELCSTILYTR